MGDPNKILTSGNAYLAVTNLAGSAGSQQQLQGIPLGTADGTSTGEVVVKVALVGQGSGTGGTATFQRGAANQATSQAATNTTSGSTQALAARATRRSYTITNLDTGTNNVFFGNTGVTTSTGQRLLPGQSINVDSTAAVFAVSSAGTPTVNFIETYD